MDDATSLLLDLPGFRVVSCEEVSDGRRVVVMQTADEHACPRCGVLVDGNAYDVRESRIKDLPMGHRPLEVVWRKRRYRCAERGCPQRVFTERSEQLPPRHRLTARLRAKLEDAASRSARAVSDVAAEYGCRRSRRGRWGAGRGRGTVPPGRPALLHDPSEVKIETSIRARCGWCSRPTSRSRRCP